MLQVVEVVFELSFGLFERCTIPVPDLSPACNAGTDHVAQIVIGNLVAEPLDKFGALRPGADKPHIAAQNVPELGNFIESGLAHESTKRCDPGIILGCPNSSCCFSILAHGAKLVGGELASAVADAGLIEAPRTRRGEPDRQDDEGYEGQANQQANQGDSE